MVFGSFIRRCIMEKKFGKVNGLVRPPTHHRGYIVYFEIGKARLSGGRWRPPAAQHGRRDHVYTIVWRRFVSSSVIITNEAKRCVGSVLLALSYLVVRRAFKAVDVEGNHLRRREADVTVPMIPLLLIMVSGSPVRPRIGSYRCPKIVSSARNGTRRRGR